MYELVEIEADTENADFESFQSQKARRSEGVVLVYCPSCGNPHVLSARHARRHTVCKPCSHGRSQEPISAYYSFWLERFSREEIQQMAKAIWGLSEVINPNYFIRMRSSRD